MVDAILPGGFGTDICAVCCLQKRRGIGMGLGKSMKQVPKVGDTLLDKNYNNWQMEAAIYIRYRDEINSHLMQMWLHDI